MNFIKNIAFTVLGLLIFVSCSDNKVMLETKIISYDEIKHETSTYLGEEEGCDKYEARWRIEFQGARDFFFPEIDDEEFEYYFETTFEKRWINGISQWIPIATQHENPSLGLSIFDIYPTHDACTFWIDSTEENRGYITFEIEYELLFVEEGNSLHTSFYSNYDMIDYYRDEKIINGFYIPHSRLERYDYSEIDSTNYVSITKKIKYRNTKKGLEQISDSSNFEKSLQKIVELGDFLQIKVIEKKYSNLFLPIGDTSRAGDKKHLGKYKHYDNYILYNCYTLAELDSVLQVEKNNIE
ncbi:hypothetical protein ACE193_05605 [Bernardetia sp. OM2101]|uniref:hypothetical protein n=1 Tax=Bernardetia sp. OM2101 TaxID=3344876 RepID=UPI0035CFEC83